MSICIEFRDVGQWNGTTVATFDTWDWTQLGQNRFQASRVGPPANAGIVDLFDYLERLEQLFGEFLDRKNSDTGALATITDLVVERVIGVNVLAGEHGSHTPTGWFPPGAVGQRVRQGPEFLPTATVGTLQAGGTGLVQTPGGSLANGQAGVLVLPTGMRWYHLSSNDAGTEELFIWLIPFAGARALSGLASPVVRQPPAQFVP